MRQLIALIILGLSITLNVGAQSYKFDFTSGKKTKDGYIKITSADRYANAKGYGYDLSPSPDGKNHAPFFFSVAVPDGNYHVTAIIGSKRSAGETTLRGESRRLFYENVKTKKGELLPCSFTINKRDIHISDKEDVRIKPRERSKLNWDDKLTFEFNGDTPQLTELIIERIENVPTVFLCGNSTVVDQDNEPWASWGQMVPRFFTDSICFANYAESGESANTFIAAGRLKKALTQMKLGDYIFMEFGHNDQKQKGKGKGPWTSFYDSLKEYIVKTREKGATIVFVTPTQRRSFGDDGKIKDTHGEYPAAMRKLAEEEGVPVIELNEMTRTLYETLGVEESRRAFVQYPANTFPGQTKALEDNTHFNPYGAYQIAKCILQGIKDKKLGLARYIKDFEGYDPAHPDDVNTFVWDLSPFTEIEKPDGN